MRRWFWILPLVLVLALVGSAGDRPEGAAARGSMARVAAGTLDPTAPPVASTTLDGSTAPVASTTLDSSTAPVASTTLGGSTAPVASTTLDSSTAPTSGTLGASASDHPAAALAAPGPLLHHLGDRGPAGPRPVGSGRLDARVPTLDAPDRRTLHLSSARAATHRYLEFRSDDALVRAGRLSWRTTAPPPFRIA